MRLAGFAILRLCAMRAFHRRSRNTRRPPEPRPRANTYYAPSLAQDVARRYICPHDVGFSRVITSWPPCHRLLLGCRRRVFILWRFCLARRGVDGSAITARFLSRRLSHRDAEAAERRRSRYFGIGLLLMPEYAMAVTLP